MHLSIILRVTGVLLSLFSLALLLPASVALIYDEDTIPTFTIAFGITLVSGIVMSLIGSSKRELRSGDGFLITVLFYLGLGFFGAIPFYLADSIEASITDAAFESLSALTTTGATVITGLDELPKSILFYRQLLQWLGGMGIIVLAVAILPMLGIGGMQLYRAESPGPVKDAKLTPRITETAKALWYLYLTLTIGCALAYWAAGMDPFDAICHSFSTVAIGGFSTHDASIGFFNSPTIEAIAIVFMIISGINFGLHFLAWNRRNPLLYFRDVEVRFYIFVLLSVTAIVCWVLVQHPEATDSPIRDGIFQTVSIATTTGFTTSDFSQWPSAAPILLMFAACAGGCAGSTAGGIKIIRVLLIFLQGSREIKRLIHPTGIFPIKLGPQRVPDRVIEAVWGFCSAYLIIFLTMVCALMLISDLDFVSAFSAVGACLNNLGPGLGDVALNYAGQQDEIKWLLMFTMLLGRLEIFTLVVLLTPRYWRR
ncbi:MAG: TrkH family potassium uptake protein [Gammaproteobacteria bacterium]|nr:TrkH family potassium uptake protein [Gammaproteobacteria bacterium]